MTRVEIGQKNYTHILAMREWCCNYLCSDKDERWRICVSGDRTWFQFTHERDAILFCLQWA